MEKSSWWETKAERGMCLDGYRRQEAGVISYGTLFQSLLLATRKATHGLDSVLDRW